MKLTVIIPVYNEEKTVEKLINIINSLFNFTIEIIVVDDCSNDRSREIINSLGSKVDKVLFHKKNYGKGAAIK